MTPLKFHHQYLGWLLVWSWVLLFYLLTGDGYVTYRSTRFRASISIQLSRNSPQLRSDWSCFESSAGIGGKHCWQEVLIIECRACLVMFGM